MIAGSILKGYMKRVLTAFFVVFLASFAACGYSFQGSGSILPDDIKTVSIRISENNTTETGLGLKLTERLVSRFERYGVLKVVEPNQDADAELITQILSVTTRTRNVTDGTDIELDLEMIVSAVLRRRNGLVLYKNPLVYTTESFASVSDVVVTSSSGFQQGGIGADTLGSLGSLEVSRGQKEQVLEDLLDETARKIYLSAVAAEF